jgi:hypothetical protein
MSRPLLNLWLVVQGKDIKTFKTRQKARTYKRRLIKRTKVQASIARLSVSDLVVDTKS